MIPFIPKKIFSQDVNLFQYLESNSEEFDTDTLHIFFHREWNEDYKRSKIIEYEGIKISIDWETLLMEEYGLESPSFILGAINISDSQKGYLIRHMGMYESNQISILIESPTIGTNKILLARSGGDGSWMYDEDSWFFDGDGDGDLDIFTWRKEKWEDERTEEWKSKSELTYRIWLDGRYVPNPSSVVDTTKFNIYSTTLDY